MFRRLDKNGDRRLDLSEFKQAIPTLEQWGITITDPVASFHAIDIDGAGFVLFDEFCLWAAAQNMDLDDDDDLEIKNEDLKQLNAADIKIDKLHKTEGFKPQNNLLDPDNEMPNLADINLTDIDCVIDGVAQTSNTAEIMP